MAWLGDSWLLEGLLSRVPPLVAVLFNDSKGPIFKKSSKWKLVCREMRVGLRGEVVLVPESKTMVAYTLGMAVEMAKHSGIEFTL